jgi:hypothetical protein
VSPAGDVNGGTPIVFCDDVGRRWTVAVRGGDALLGWAALDFTSETGERRTSECCAPESGTWADIDEAAWRALLSHADVVSR